MISKLVSYLTGKTEYIKGIKFVRQLTGTTCFDTIKPVHLSDNLTNREGC